MLFIIQIKNYQDDKADVILKYTPDEARTLKHGAIIYVYFVFKEDKLLLLFAYILWTIRDSTVKNHFRTDQKSLRHKNSEFTKIISQYIRDFPSRKAWVQHIF